MYTKIGNTAEEEFSSERENFPRMVFAHHDLSRCQLGRIQMKVGEFVFPSDDKKNWILWIFVLASVLLWFSMLFVLLTVRAKENFWPSVKKAAPEFVCSKI